jgi:hypothetical protein
MFLGAIPAFRIPAGGNFILVRRVALAARRQVLRFALRGFVPVPHVGFHIDGIPMNTSRTKSCKVNGLRTVPWSGRSGPGTREFNACRTAKDATSEAGFEIPDLPMGSVAGDAVALLQAADQIFGIAVRDLQVLAGELPQRDFCLPPSCFHWPLIVWSFTTCTSPASTTE